MYIMLRIMMHTRVCIWARMQLFFHRVPLARAVGQHSARECVQYVFATAHAERIFLNALCVRVCCIVRALGCAVLLSVVIWLETPRHVVAGCIFNPVTQAPPMQHFL